MLVGITPPAQVYLYPYFLTVQIQLPMKQSVQFFITLFCLQLFTTQASAQVFENTYVWHNQSHAAWKVEPNAPFGYVIAGGKYFSSPNTSIYLTGFDEFGSQQWTISHASGFTSLQSFWKSFVRTSNGYLRYFIVSAGEQGGHKAYALAVNSYGMKFWDRASPLPFGIEFGGVTNATNGGFVATGGTNLGQFAVVNFDPYGELQWAYQLPVSGYGWSIAPAVGGGYLLAGGMTVVKVDHAGNYQWTANINLPNSPSGAYSYAEFEEITPIPDGTSFLVTGSCFSNSHSGVYTARVSYTGSVMWAKVNDEVNTSGVGTPVNWINNSVLNNNDAEILTSWRRGPVSAGGTMYYQRMSFTGANIGGITSLGNTIPVREAFMTKAHGKIVIGGTRGNLTAAYSYVNATLPGFDAGDDDRSAEPFVESEPFMRIQSNASNARPVFEYPLGSRQFAAKLRVFPNPSSGLLNVGGAIEPGALLRVFDPTGKLVLERRIQEEESLLQLDLSAQASGLYSVEMIGASGVSVQKVIVE